MNRSLRILSGAIFLLQMILQSVFAEVRLPHLVTDGMILQRDTPVKIWGWADAGERVSLKFNNQSFGMLQSRIRLLFVMHGPTIREEPIYIIKKVYVHRLSKRELKNN